jgi:hypothetical protein
LEKAAFCRREKEVICEFNRSEQELTPSIIAVDTRSHQSSGWDVVSVLSAVMQREHDGTIACSALNVIPSGACTIQSKKEGSVEFRKWKPDL